mmetsp:Transcript_35143/g.110631  ORF Transcript_35143/g.110631 Transcript_35143/m.110631 type:complete len:838 (-) Transcript_35143:147-2660(-)
MVATLIILQIPKRAYVDASSEWLKHGLIEAEDVDDANDISRNVAQDIYEQIAPTGTLPLDYLIPGLISLQNRRNLPSALDRDYKGKGAEKLVKEERDAGVEDLSFEHFFDLLKSMPKKLSRHELSRISSESPEYRRSIIYSDFVVEDKEVTLPGMVLIDVEMLIRTKLRHLRRSGYITGIPHWSPSEGVSETEYGKIVNGSQTPGRPLSVERERPRPRARSLSVESIKSGPLWKQAVQSRVNWKCRHFVLTDRFLTYYEKADDAKSHNITAKEKGEVKLTSNTYCRAMDDRENSVARRHSQGSIHHGGKHMSLSIASIASGPTVEMEQRFGFMVITPSQTLRLAASSPQDRDAWMASISVVIDRLRDQKAFLNTDERELDSTFMVQFMTLAVYATDIVDALELAGVGKQFGVIAVSDLGMAHAPKEMMAHRYEHTHQGAEENMTKRIMVAPTSRMIVEQVVEQVHEGAVFNFDYAALVIIASILAGVGLASNNTVVIVASMLVSPIMGPIMAFTFGAVVHELKLSRLGFRNELVSLSVCVIVGGVIGACLGAMDVEDDIPTEEMSARGSRTGLLLGLAIAIPSGMGVALSVLGHNTSSLVGVAISASLLPPAVQTGIELVYGLILRGRGNISLSDTLLEEAGISFSLTVMNIVCIFVTAVATFKLKEVAPIEEKSRLFAQDLRANREYQKAMREGTPHAGERQSYASSRGSGDIDPTLGFRAVHSDFDLHTTRGRATLMSPDVSRAFSIDNRSFRYTMGDKEMEDYIMRRSSASSRGSMSSRGSLSSRGSRASRPFFSDVTSADGGPSAAALSVNNEKIEERTDEVETPGVAPEDRV